MIKANKNYFLNLLWFSLLTGPNVFFDVFMGRMQGIANSMETKYQTSGPVEQPSMVLCKWYGAWFPGKPTHCHDNCDHMVWSVWNLICMDIWMCWLQWLINIIIQIFIEYSGHHFNRHFGKKTILKSYHS